MHLNLRHMTTRNKYIAILISAHVLIMLALLVIVILLGVDFHKLLLRDDGYYDTAGLLVKGQPPNSLYGLGYPCLLTVLYLFPVFMHPFLRLLISVLFTCGAIVIVFKIFEKYFTHKEIFWGGLVLVLNPLYLHWMFRSRVEAPLVLLLGLIIFYSQRYLHERRFFDLLFALAFMAISIFTKPVFMLIPFFLACLSLILRSNRVLILSITLAVVSVVAFVGTKKLVDNRQKDVDYYQVPSIVGSAFYVDAIVRNRDFKTQYMYIENEQGDTIRNPRLTPGDDWMMNYEKKYGNRNPIMMSLRFATEKPGMVIQQLIVNPFLAFSLSSTESETFLHLVVNLCLMILAILNIAKIRCKSRVLYVHLAIVFSLYALLVLIHSRGPYFLPIIPYLFVFTGRPLRSMVSVIQSKNMRIGG